VQTKNVDYNVRQSNSYIILYAAGLTIICGGLLAFAAQGLKEPQERNIAQERRENILSTVMELKKGDNVNAIYDKRVNAFVVDYNGNIKEGVKPADVNLAVEYKKPPRERLLPVYEFKSETDPEKVEGVVFPLFGFGLWDNIWGFVALESDMNTVRGVKFQHKGETPGLGARINTDEIQLRYKGKKVFEGNDLVSVTMMKGEGNDYSDDAHRVDGMSGATLTANGVNAMLKDYLSSYMKYIQKFKANS
jgi:Na+-transporting NADH:ubiquinone oxidoreductase subunit C